TVVRGRTACPHFATGASFHPTVTLRARPFRAVQILVDSVLECLLALLSEGARIRAAHGHLARIGRAPPRGRRIPEGGPACTGHPRAICGPNATLIPIGPRPLAIVMNGAVDSDSDRACGSQCDE